MPKCGLDEVVGYAAAGDVEMREAVRAIGFRRAAAMRNICAAADFIALDADAVEQHDRIFDLTGDDALVGGALEPLRGSAGVERHAFALAQLHPVGICGVAVACFCGAAEIARPPWRSRASRRARRRARARRDCRASRMAFGRRPLSNWASAPARSRGDARAPVEQQHAVSRTARRGRRARSRADTNAPPRQSPASPRARRDRSRRSASSPRRPWDRRRCASPPRASAATK